MSSVSKDDTRYDLIDMISLIRNVYDTPEVPVFKNLSNAKTSSIWLVIRTRLSR